MCFLSGLKKIWVTQVALAPSPGTDAPEGHIKGENLLVDSSGNVAKLPHFGLANM